MAYVIENYSHKVDPLYNKNKRLISTIRLMLNPKDEDHLKLEEEFPKLIDLVEKSYGDHVYSDEINEVEDEIIKYSRKIIKEAWEQAKQLKQ